MPSKIRDIADILGVTEAANPTNAVLTSVADGSGLVVYATLDDLPTSGLTAGDQAYITSTNRLYVSNGSGWYNVALFNATPTLSISPSGAVALATDGSTPTIITLIGTDSDNADANLVYSVESDGSFSNIATLSQDSSVFTITPLAEGSATPGSSTLTFKVSDGISFGSGTTTFSLAFSTFGSVQWPGPASTTAHISVTSGQSSLSLTSSMEMWVYPDNVPSVDELFITNRNSASTVADGDWWIDKNSGYLRFGYRVVSSGVNSFINTTRPIPQGTWSHICLRRVVDNLYLTYNGTLVGSATLTGTKTLYWNGSQGSMLIGGFDSHTLYNFRGKIADVRFGFTTNYYGTNNPISPPTTSFNIQPNWPSTASQAYLCYDQNNKLAYYTASAALISSVTGGTGLVASTANPYGL